jgi:hypothetical protein
MKNTSYGFHSWNICRSCLLSAVVLAAVMLGGCSKHYYTRAEPAVLPQAEGRTNQGGEVRTPLPPPQIQGEPASQNVREAAPAFPRLPDWASTFWDISSP